MADGDDLFVRTKTITQDRYNIDAVILDMNMPCMEVGTPCERLMEIDPEVNVLLSAGFCLERQAGEMHDNGWKGFIQKPPDIEQLPCRLIEIFDFDQPIL